MSQELLLNRGLGVTVDDKLGDPQYADVLVRDGVIVVVGSGLSTSSADAEITDCEGRLMTPGLVDTHRHV
jgi:5-methylthioadenosine/S-adenosylhomocysteine deaminase